MELLKWAKTPEWWFGTQKQFEITQVKIWCFYGKKKDITQWLTQASLS
jgi:hypothetical protein